ncbi:hypothetical protein HKBW3S42_02275, partial [Candidatus Hakubella thermalkaliphila]
MKPEQNLIVSPSPHVKRITSVEEI